jgi:N-acylneuraminate cytidylyltransferase/CMP-N,N'-diacetyllegionaminic acid synthase
MTERGVLALIPARGGSKGIPQKNIVELAGDPLIAHTIQAGLEARQIDRVIVSSDEDEIRSVARTHGADVPFRRPADLATDDAPTGPVVEHAIEWLAERGETYESVVVLQPTSPLRTAGDIDGAVQRYNDEQACSVVSVAPDHSYRWRRRPDGAERINYAKQRQRRQDKQPEYVENGAIYIVDVESFMSTGDLQSGVTVLYEMDPKRSVDIDTQFDRWLVEQIMTEWGA